MKVGDRVTVIAETDEYHGFSGDIVGVAPDGKVLVDVEIPVKYRVAFDPHAVELERMVRRRSSRA